MEPVRASATSHQLWILAVLPALEQQLCLPSWPRVCLKLPQEKLITTGDSFS